jgi:hypothetical protein
MPNWVYNQVTITGPEDQVGKIVEQLGKPVPRSKDDGSGIPAKSPEIEYKDPEGGISFWNVLSPPEEKWDLYFGRADGSEDKTWNWYPWNNANWGTKWDACHASKEVVSTDTVKYYFETAWSHPYEVLGVLGDQYRDVSITNDWEEEQGFGGTYEFTGGVYLVHDEYDVPRSHADMMERRGSCYCEDVDSGDEPWDDCPTKEDANARFPVGVIVAGTGVQPWEVPS